MLFETWAEQCDVPLQSGTVAAGMAVGNTLAYVAPQLAGAIDIVVVKQPDGTLKSSPFYGGLGFSQPSFNTRTFSSRRLTVLLLLQ